MRFPTMRRFELLLSLETPTEASNVTINACIVITLEDAQKTEKTTNEYVCVYYSYMNCLFFK